MEVLDRLVTHGSRGEAALLAGDLNLREDEASKPKAASAVGYVMNFNVSFFSFAWPFAVKQSNN